MGSEKSTWRCAQGTPIVPTNLQRKLGLSIPCFTYRHRLTQNSFDDESRNLLFFFGFLFAQSKHRPWEWLVLIGGALEADGVCQSGKKSLDSHFVDALFGICRYNASARKSLWVRNCPSEIESFISHETSCHSSHFSKILSVCPLPNMQELWRNFPRVYVISYQGSEVSTSEGITKVFERARTYKKLGFNEPA